MEIIGDIELLKRSVPAARTLGITGTNGKSTTTALLGHILKTAGVPVQVGGKVMMSRTVPSRTRAAAPVPRLALRAPERRAAAVVEDPVALLLISKHELAEARRADHATKPGEGHPVAVGVVVEGPAQRRLALEGDAFREKLEARTRDARLGRVGLRLRLAVRGASVPVMSNVL